MSKANAKKTEAPAMTKAEIVADIVAACTEAEKRGYVLVSGDWGYKINGKQCACALASVMLRAQQYPEEFCGYFSFGDIFRAVTRRYGWVTSQIGYFIGGFDGKSCQGEATEEYEIGQLVRAKVLHGLA